MELYMSAQARIELSATFGTVEIGCQMLERSRDVWSAGTRTRPIDIPKQLRPFVFLGKSLSGEFLVVTLSAFRPKRLCGNLLGRSHHHGGHHGRSGLVRILLSQPQVPSVWATRIALDPASRLVQQTPQYSLPPLYRLRPEFLGAGWHALLPLPTPPRENRRHRPACGRRQRHATHGPSVWRESEHRLADRRARRPTCGGVSRRESLPCPSAPGAGR